MKINLEDLLKLIKAYPNNTQLGAEIRRRYNETNRKVRSDKKDKGRDEDRLRSTFIGK